MGLFDVHAHLTHPQFDIDRTEVLARARAAGLTSIISNGLNLDDNRAVLELSKAETLVRPAFGLYPVDAVLPEMRAAGIDYPREGEEHGADAAIEFIERHLDVAIAIGEIGLDGYWVPEAFWEKQETVFRRLVILAMNADKPIICHTRKRELRAFEILAELGAKRVIWHCFGSKFKLAERISGLGHFLSIPCNVRRSEAFTKIVSRIPRAQLLFETDCPYLSPDPGDRNEPARVRSTLEYVAEIWGVSESDALAIFEENYRKLFHKDP